MTVTVCDEDEVGVPTVWCVWFGEYGFVAKPNFERAFPAITIEKVSAKPVLGGVYVPGPRGPKGWMDR